jgi:hypothetical protein
MTKSKGTRGPLNDHIVSRIVGAGTSAGANYVEADDSISKREFLKCIGSCKKEAREGKHFLRMAVPSIPELKVSLVLALSFVTRAPSLRWCHSSFC